MASCEMCGGDASLQPVKVAGSLMKLCSSCSVHGKSLQNETTSVSFYKRKKEVKEYQINDDAIETIQKKLSQKGWDVHQLARAISIKESTLQKYMTKKLKLDLENARKIEKFLEISLVSEVSSQSIEDFIEDEDTLESQAPSLGDMLKEQLNKNK
jgi:uncharacterized protein (TIGR00270 family)